MRINELPRRKQRGIKKNQDLQRRKRRGTFGPSEHCQKPNKIERKE
jgi:hypothetical protein